jgi:serralysin
MAATLLALGGGAALATHSDPHDFHCPDGSGAGCTLVGTDGDDFFYTNNGPDFIYGEGGNDSMFSHGGDDVLKGGEGDDGGDGGPGSDKMYGGPGFDALEGEEDNDRIYGEGDADQLYGGEGDDYLYGQDGNDFLLAGDAGTDRVSGGAGLDGLLGGQGPDKLQCPDNFKNYSWGKDKVLGEDGNDTICGQTDDHAGAIAGIPDYLYGERGNDIINADFGAKDEVSGGPDNDRIWARDLEPGEKSRAYAKDIIDCGPGTDTVENYDKGLDVVKGNCERK